MAEEITVIVDDTQEEVSLFVDSGITVDSVFGRTGNVVAVDGDYTTALVPEVTNLYYTEARVSANSAVVLNTAKDGITPAQASEITANTTTNADQANQITTSRFESRCLGQAVDGRIDNYTSALANIGLKETSTASLLFDAKICGVGQGKLFNLLPFDSYKDFDVVRNGTATYVGSDGLIKTASANVPRIDWTDSANPVLLTEPQGTNLLTYSEDFTQWTTLNGGLGSLPVVTSNNIVSPEGIQNADKIVFDKGIASSNSDFSLIRLNYGGVDIDGTASVYIKSDSPVDVEISTDDGTYQTVNVTTEWQRATVSDATSDRLSIGLRGTDPSNTDATVYVWGAQLETGDTATSYIPTEGTTVTRIADVVTGAGSVNEFNSEEGVMYAQIASLETTPSASRYISLTDGTYNERIAILYSSGATNSIRAFLRVGGSVQVDFSVSLTDQKALNEIAFKWKINDFSLYVNGVEVATDSSGSVSAPNTLNNLSFSEIGTSGGAFSGKTAKLRTYKSIALAQVDLPYIT